MTHDPNRYPLEELLPQSGQMILIDRVIAIGDETITVEVDIKPNSLFADASGATPAWVGIEFMAQAIAAYSGYFRKYHGKEVDLGFLLGTRLYECTAGPFPPGTTLRVEAHKEVEGMNGLAVFACRIVGEAIEATAKLNVFLPESSAKYLEERPA